MICVCLCVLLTLKPRLRLEVPTTGELVRGISRVSFPSLKETDQKIIELVHFKSIFNSFRFISFIPISTFPMVILLFLLNSGHICSSFCYRELRFFKKQQYHSCSVDGAQCLRLTRSQQGRSVGANSKMQICLSLRKLHSRCQPSIDWWCQVKHSVPVWWG